MKDTNSSAEHSAPKDNSNDPAKPDSASQSSNPPVARRPQIGDSMPAGFSPPAEPAGTSKPADRSAGDNKSASTSKDSSKGNSKDSPKGIDQALANTMAAAAGGSPSEADTAKANGSGRSGKQGSRGRGSGQSGDRNRRGGKGDNGGKTDKSGQPDRSSSHSAGGRNANQQASGNRRKASERNGANADGQSRRSRSQAERKADAKADSKASSEADLAEDSQSGQTLGRYMMLVHVEEGETHVALLEGRSLVEYYVGHHDQSASHIHGNIYLGQVENVLPGMESAFIDIGTNKNAVLYQGDVVYNSEEFEHSSKNPPISQMLKSRQTILCQVIKNPIGQKGARLTQEVSLAGRYVVLMPNQEGISVSKQLSEKERKRFREMLNKVKPKGFGVIVRTAVRNAAEKDIQADVQRLLADWEELRKLQTTAKVPSLLREEPPLEVQLIREQFDGDFRSVITNDQKTYQQIKSYVKSTAPKLSGRVQFYDESGDSLPLFDRYHVKSQLRKALDTKVWLPSGGSIIIERTEALTVIDVNTGRNLGSDKLSDTIFENNLEAADEIARQLRLRDIGGIIVIDFIDMDYAEQRRKLLRAFKDALRRDKTRVYVSDVSELGLVQMTRKRIGEGLVESFSHICDTCEGEGRVMLNLIDGI